MSKKSSVNLTFESIVRGSILFLLGSIMGFVLNVLQMEYRTNLSPKNLLFFLQTNWWTLPLCGFAAIYIGLCYPFFDHKLNQCHYNDRDWTAIIRCFAIYIGLNHLCAKIHFSSSAHFLIILNTFCIVFWYWFDKTKFGFLFNVFNALFAVIGVNLLRYLGIINVSKIEFDYLQTCFSCLIFCGGVTFGNIGRLLNIYDEHASTKSNSTVSHHLHSD